MSAPTNELIRAEIAEESASMVMNLLSNAYTRPTDAVIRELVTNGIDALRMKGNKTPVRVELPTTDQPNFIVEDAGIGMSKDQALSNFANFGNSIKLNDPLAIGVYGIGAKAIWAVAPGFSMVTTHQGMTTTMEFTLDDTGAPAHRVISHERSTRRSGTIITVPISDTNEENINDWYEAAERVNAAIDEGLVEICMDNEPVQLLTFAQLADAEHSNDHGLYIRTRNDNDSRVIMGNIGYELPMRLFAKYPKEVVLFAPAKSLELTHTREHIKDTKANEKTLDELWAKFIDAALGSAKIKELENATTEVGCNKVIVSLDYTQEQLLKNDHRFDSLLRELGHSNRMYLNTHHKTSFGCIVYEPSTARRDSELGPKRLALTLAKPDDNILVDMPHTVSTDPKTMANFSKAVSIARENNPDLYVFVVSKKKFTDEVAQIEAQPDRTIPFIDTKTLTWTDWKTFVAENKTSTKKREATPPTFVSVCREDKLTLMEAGGWINLMARKKRHRSQISLEEIQEALQQTQSRIIVTVNDAEIDDHDRALGVLHATTPRLNDVVAIASSRVSAKRIKEATGAQEVRTLSEHVTITAREFLLSMTTAQRAQYVADSINDYQLKMWLLEPVMKQYPSFKKYMEKLDCDKHPTESSYYRMFRRDHSTKARNNKTVITASGLDDTVLGKAPASVKDDYPLLMELHERTVNFSEGLYLAAYREDIRSKGSTKTAAV